jgi:hypothetical protein
MDFIVTLPHTQSGYFRIRNHVDRFHATVNHAMFPSPRVCHGSNNGRRPGLAGVTPCGRSSGRELITRGLGGEEQTVSLVAASVGREVVGVGLAMKRSDRRCLELGAPVLWLTGYHRRYPERERTKR